MPDVVVLGADGFIGSHLCDALVARGLQVRAFTRNGERLRNLTPHPALEVVSGDFLNQQDLACALAGSRQVVHLVSTSTPASSSSDLAFDVDTNVRGSVRLLELCVEAGVERILFASTGGAIYGQDLDRPLREDDAALPVSPYAIGKLAIEGYLRYFRQAHGIRTTTLRISNPYGERQALKGVQGAVPIFLRRLLLDEPITVFGDGSMVRDYLYVRDLAEMMAEVAVGDPAHDLYNVASGTALSVLELIEVLGAAVGVTPRIQHLPERATDVHRVLLDTTRFEAEFGALATTSIADGVARTAAHVTVQVEASADSRTTSTKLRT